MVQGDVDHATLIHVALVSSCADFGGVADEAVAEGGDSPRVPVWSAGGSLVLDRRCASTKGAARVVFAVSYGTAGSLPTRRGNLLRGYEKRTFGDEGVAQNPSPQQACED